jgi:M6 family metalloprotease-like protein
MKNSKSKLVFLLGLIFLTACTKESGELFANCKLPIADGRGGAAIGGFPRYSSRLNSTGTVNVTFLMVDFSDSVAATSVASVYANVSDAKQFFTDMSYGRLTYNMVAPGASWVRMPHPTTSYNFTTGLRAYIEDAVAAADAAGMNFATTDLVVVIQNPETTTISEIGPATLLDAGQGITVDGRELLNFVTSGNDYATHGYLWLNHESTHTLGLVDLYASSPASSSFADLVPYTGGFSLMGVSSVTAMFAPSHTAWERYVLGWIDDSQVDCVNPHSSGDHTATITPINTSGGKKAVIIPVGETRAVVVESRRATSYDTNMTKEGALVYLVDSSIQSGNGPMRVYPNAGSSDPWLASSPRAVGESVTVEGIKVEVTSSSPTGGDTIRVSVDGILVAK